MEDFERAFAGKLDSMDSFCILSDECAALILNCAYGCAGKLYGVLGCGLSVTTEDYKVPAFLAVVSETGYPFWYFDGIALAKQLKAYFCKQGIVPFCNPGDSAGIELSHALCNKILNFRI